MLHVVRSELTRLAQRRTLIIWFGLMAIFALLVSSLMATFASRAGGNLPSVVVSPTRAELESPAGLMAGLAAAANLFGVVTLSFWAFFTAQDYSSRLIRLLVAAEPRRERLLIGKVVALTLVTALAVTAAAIATGLAAPTTGAGGIDTSAWGTDLPTVVGEAWLHLFLSQLVWGVLGLVIAVISRSAMIAVSIGVGYVLVVESLFRIVDGAPTEQLLGTTLGAIAKGGTDAVSYASALTLGAAYVIAGLLAAGLIFARRDVTD